MLQRFRSLLLVGFGMAMALAGMFTWETFSTQAQTAGGCQAFPQTNHKVCGRFLTYWKAHGGLAQQGYPISEEFTELSDLNGQPYTVQYFERAEFEYHPEKQPPYDVLLAQLGTFRAKEKYPNGFPPSSQVPFYEDRTGPLEMLQSYYNAINRREYQRAYGYFESGPTVLPYAQFVQGYADTASVTLMTGQFNIGAAAGSSYAEMPTVIIATHTDGSVHTFYGCYTLRRTNPGVDPNPASTLWRIYSTNIKAAPANTPVSTLLKQGCP